MINSSSTNSALEQGLKLDGSGKEVFIDFIDPAYSEEVSADFEFQTASIIPIPDGAPARVVVRDRVENKIVCIVPFMYRSKFRFKELIEHAGDQLPSSIDLSAYFDKTTKLLKDGDYKICIDTVLI